MNSIANLQSLQNAVYLLSALSPAQNNSNQNQESSATATSKSPAQTALSSIYEGKNQTAAAAQSAQEAASIAASADALSISIGAIKTAAQSGGDVWSIQIANGQVTGSFKDNGDDPVNAALDYQDYQTDLADNSMTSQQLSEAVYSGQGVPFIGNSNDTFLGEIQSVFSLADYMISSGQNMEAWAAEGMPANDQWGFSSAFGNYTPTQINAMGQASIAEGDQYITTFSEVQTAYYTGALTVQNLVDVPGADYNATTTYYSSGGSETETATGSGANDAIYSNSPDGLQHAGLGLGYASLYLTW